MKYPRTIHLPSSPGASRDDLRLAPRDADGLLGGRGGPLVVTEKMDGENTTMTRERVHARSLTTSSHPSRDWVRALHGRIRHLLDDDLRVCGENLFARHSVGYDQLASYFLVFNAWKGDECLGWDDTCALADALGLSVVPVLAEVDHARESDLVRAWRDAGGESVSEGFVVRTRDGFAREVFTSSVAKWVRAGHVTTSTHWMHQGVVPNSLAR